MRQSLWLITSQDVTHSCTTLATARNFRVPSKALPVRYPRLRKKSTLGSPDASVTPTSTAAPFVSSRTSSFRASMDELEHVFKKFYINGDGKISASELSAILGSLGYTETEEELRKMVKEVDAVGDGCISFEEFVELNTKGVDGDEIMANLREAFFVYDRDGNGEITEEELHDVLRSLGEECTVGECRKMISGVDRDGDGKISFEEFKVMMTVGSRMDVSSFT